MSTSRNISLDFKSLYMKQINGRVWPNQKITEWILCYKEKLKWDNIASLIFGELTTITCSFQCSLPFPIVKIFIT